MDHCLIPIHIKATKTLHKSNFMYRHISKNCTYGKLLLGLPILTINCLINCYEFMTTIIPD